jgi:hypothetical protein
MPDVNSSLMGDYLKIYLLGMGSRPISLLVR